MVQEDTIAAMQAAIATSNTRVQAMADEVMGLRREVVGFGKSPAGLTAAAIDSLVREAVDRMPLDDASRFRELWVEVFKHAETLVAIGPRTPADLRAFVVNVGRESTTDHLTRAELDAAVAASIAGGSADTLQSHILAQSTTSSTWGMSAPTAVTPAVLPSFPQPCAPPAAPARSISDVNQVSRDAVIKAGLPAGVILSNRTLRVPRTSIVELSIRLREKAHADTFVNAYRFPDPELDGLCARYGSSQGSGNGVAGGTNMPLFTTEQKMAAAAANAPRSGAHDNVGGGNGSRSLLDAACSRSLHCSAVPHEPSRWITVQCWNIAGQFSAKYERQPVRDLLQQHDINIVQETWMCASHADAIRVKRGHQWGGLIAFLRTDIDYVVSSLSGPDLLVLDLGSHWLVSAYIPPSGSNWFTWTDPIMLVGDLNARTWSLQSGHPPTTLSRNATDDVVSTRGRALLRLYTELELYVLNGTPYENISPGAATSFQQIESRSTIDYLAVSAIALADASVRNLVMHPALEHSDHVRLCFALRTAAPHAPRPSQRDFGVAIRDTRKDLMQAAGPLDNALRDLLASVRTVEEAVDALYGPVYNDGPAVSVYIAVRMFGHLARVAVFWGSGSSV
ncbi:hypothetical protein BD626DRAFT_571261 [Schizophyllum amplum]|uniref:Endonuclease/exonuclease/phosphatase domain-containing protein n=1 Tax=Schizophyllum amplum TaxID=97359 RepID=A0A550C7V6_9AGAR|nr:hypothetical protein BD626DRAFT_571261 [Auriculariopsis ampla]